MAVDLLLGDVIRYMAAWEREILFGTSDFKLIRRRLLKTWYVLLCRGNFTLVRIAFPYCPNRNFFHRMLPAYGGVLFLSAIPFTKA